MPNSLYLDLTKGHLYELNTINYMEPKSSGDKSI